MLKDASASAVDLSPAVKDCGVLLIKSVLYACFAQFGPSFLLIVRLLCSPLCRITETQGTSRNGDFWIAAPVSSVL